MNLNSDPGPTSGGLSLRPASLHTVRETAAPAGGLAALLGRRVPRTTSDNLRSPFFHDAASYTVRQPCQAGPASCWGCQRGCAAAVHCAVQPGGADRVRRATASALVRRRCAFFAVIAAVAVRGTANEVSRAAGLRASAGTASNLRLGITVLGYLVVAATTLTLLQVPIEKLLLSGAITGVVLGIAAQQALANLFAGLVLLTSRPFEVGSWILLLPAAWEASTPVRSWGLA